jgi:hypothetical protein
MKAPAAIKMAAAYLSPRGGSMRCFRAGLGHRGYTVTCVPTSTTRAVASFWDFSSAINSRSCRRGIPEMPGVLEGAP